MGTLDCATGYPSKARLDALVEEESTTTSKQILAVENRTQQELQRDLDVFQSLDHASQANIINKHKQLDRRLRDSGFYDCDYSAYLFDVFRKLRLGLLSYYFLHKGW